MKYMTINEVIEEIREGMEQISGHSLPDWTGKDVFEYFSNPYWRNLGDEPGYLIGLCEDEWDYYWIWINNKESELHFMTCCFSIKEKCNTITKRWSREEKQNIRDKVFKHFDEHPNEKLLFFIWDNIDNE